MLKQVFLGGAALAALSAVAIAGETNKDVRAPRPLTVIVSGDSAGATGGAIALAGSETGDEPAEAVKLGEYWLGVAVARPGERETKGLTVENVVPDSPAAKAGLKPGDVLLKAGGKELKSVPDLVDSVNQAKQNKLDLELQRNGKTEKVPVTPAKRPAEMFEAPLPELPGLPAIEQGRKFIERLQNELGDGKDGTFKFQIMGAPGAIVGGNVVFKLEPLPDDMTVTISKTGKKPAEITVKQGDQKWEVTEEQLDKLPKEVRPHVDAMLGRREFPLGGHIRVLPGPGVPLPGKAIIERPLQRAENAVEKRLEEMGKRIEKLSQAVEELRENHAKRKADKAELKEEGLKEPKAEKTPKPEKKTEKALKADKAVKAPKEL